MEFFKRAEVFRLKSGHQDKYLVVNKDEETVSQNSHGETTKGCWAVELVEGKSNVIRLRNCHTYKYLASTNKSFLFGMTGKKVAQRLRLDTSVEWEPIKEGNYVKLKSHVGTFLRGNRGPPPWRNSVTHDPQDHWTLKDDMVLWIVDIVKLNDFGLGDDGKLTEDDVVNEIHMSGRYSPELEDGYNSDDQKSGDSESFGKLQSMLAALEDDHNSPKGTEINASKEI